MKAAACAVAVAALAMTTVVACGSSSSSNSSSPPPPNAAVVVTLKNIAFNPATVTIKVGQTVAWHFDDGSIVHNVTSSTQSWRSSDQDSGYYTHTFTAPGTYPYTCTIHSGMDGKVIVTAS